MSVTNPAFNPSGKPEVDAIKNAVRELEAVIMANTTLGRRSALALTHLEICGMFAVKAAIAGD